MSKYQHPMSDVTWHGIDSRRYWHLLESVPTVVGWQPEAGFLCGEPYGEDARGNSTYIPYLEIGDRYFEGGRPVSRADWDLGATKARDRLIARLLAEGKITTQDLHQSVSEEAVLRLERDDHRTERETLLEQLQDLAEQEGRGFFWFKRVAEAGGGMAKMSANHIRAALKNPDQYNA